jgi:hypothetical protein
MPDEEFEKVEGQGLDRNQLRSRAQLAALRIENHIAEMEPQERAPWSSRRSPLFAKSNDIEMKK